MANAHRAIFFAGMTLSVACLVGIDEDKIIRGGPDAAATVDATVDASSDASDASDGGKGGDATMPPDAALFEGHGYLVRCADAGSWSAAYSAAVDMGGHLVTLTSDNERIKVMSLVGASSCQPGRGSWMGYRQNQTTKVEPDGGWEWITGETVTISPWASGEPNNAGDEDFGVLRSDGAFQDEPDDGRAFVNSYVIEFDGL